MRRKALLGRTTTALAIATVLAASGAGAQDRAAPKGKPKQRNNAADVYVMAIDEARRVFRIKAPEMLNLPYEATEDGYRGDYWVDKCQRATVATTLFAQASRIKHCSFGCLPTGVSEFSKLSPVLWQLRTLVYAHGIQNLSNSPDATLADADSLLHHARQMCRGPSTDAVSLGYLAEANGLQLIEKVLQRSQRTKDTEARIRKLLEQHRQRRVTRAQLADVAFEETMQRLEAVPGLIPDERSRLRIVDRLTKVLSGIRDPDDQSSGHQYRFPAMAARKWADELRKVKRPAPTDPALAKAFRENLRLPALTSVADLINRHTISQKKLRELFEELPR